MDHLSKKDIDRLAAYGAGKPMTATAVLREQEERRAEIRREATERAAKICEEMAERARDKDSSFYSPKAWAALREAAARIRGEG